MPDAAPPSRETRNRAASLAASRLGTACVECPAGCEWRVVFPGRTDEADTWVVLRVTEDKTLETGLVTADRWVSQSIEADVQFQREDLRVLLAEELADAGWSLEGSLRHYRDEQGEYVFLAKITKAGASAAGRNAVLEEDGSLAERLAGAVEACVRCFGEFGDLRQDAADPPEH